MVEITKSCILRQIAPKFRKPILLINGENDIRTPVWMSRKVLDLLPSDIPRELIVDK